MLTHLLPGVNWQVGDVTYRNSTWDAYGNYFGQMLGVNSSYYQHNMGNYIDEDGILRSSGFYRNGTGYAILFGLERPSVMNADATNATLGSSNHGILGTYLVSDGGVTLSSQLDPTMNQNNPNAPINDVSAPVGGALLGLLAFGLGTRRRRD